MRYDRFVSTYIPYESSVQLPGGPRLAYRDWGGRGRPIVLAHGLASSYRIWDFVAPLLAPRHRVVALDQRAHGRSERPDGSFDLSTYAADLTAFLDALGLERILLVGHSWGGNVAVQFGFEQPRRAAGLVLVDGGFLELSSRPGWTWERAQQELAPPKLAGLRTEELLKRARQGDLASIWSPAVADSLLGHFEQLPDGHVRPWLRREHHMKILRGLWDHRPSQLWEQLRCPVLLVPARRNEPDQRQAERQAAKAAAVDLALRKLKHGQVLWMEDTIHDVPLQRPHDLAHAIDRFTAELTW
jgi:pimeloyl-ACP methyl ester carboxylesterase